MNATARRAASRSIAVRKRERLSTGSNPAVVGVALPIAESDSWWPVYDDHGRKVAVVKPKPSKVFTLRRAKQEPEENAPRNRADRRHRSRALSARQLRILQSRQSRMLRVARKACPLEGESPVAHEARVVRLVEREERDAVRARRRRVRSARRHNRRVH